MRTSIKQARNGACLLVLLLIANFSKAAAAELQFDVFVGFDGYVAPSKWIPLTFEIHNPGESFNGIIVINAGGVGGVKTQVPVELPTGTRKRLQAPVFLSSGYVTWNISLVDSEGKKRAEHKDVQPRTQLAGEAHLLGALSRLQQGIPVFPAVQPSMSASQPVAAYLQPALFADNPILLEGLHSIYLSSEIALNLTPPQVSALIAWLYQGGHLIVGIDEMLEAQSLTWLRGLLPMEFNETRTVTLRDELENWIRSGTNSYAAESRDNSIVGKPFAIAAGIVRDGKVLVETHGVPLVVRTTRGRGKLTLLPFSPERQPLLSWKNKNWFWAKVCEVPKAVFISTETRVRSGWTLDSFYGALVETRQVRRLPITSLILMLVAYLAVIGPLDRYWLVRKKMEIWTWVTFPCYVALFSGLFYVVAFMLRSGDSEYNELHIVDMHPGSSQTLWAGTTYGLIYSPANKTYLLQGKGKFSGLRGERASPWGGDRKGLDTFFIGNQGRAEVRVPVWTSKLIISDWRDYRAPVLTAKFDANELIITSHLDRPLTNLAFAVSNRIYFAGDMGAKTTKTVSLTQGKWQPLNSWVKNGGPKYLDMVRQRSSSWRGNKAQAPDLASSAMAAAFIRYANRKDQDWEHEKFEDEDLVPLVEQGYGVLLAWVDNHTFLEPMNDFTPGKSSRNTLLRIALPPEK